MSDEITLNGAVKEAMAEQKCRYLVSGSAVVLCYEHPWTKWDFSRDECGVVGSAVRAGWAAALRLVADDLDREADAVDRKPPYIYDRMQTEIVTDTYRDAADRIRSLLPSAEGDQP